MIDLNTKNTIITLEIQTSYIKAAEFICEKLDMKLDTYLNDCILSGVNADLEDQLIFSKSMDKESPIDIILNLKT